MPHRDVDSSFHTRPKTVELSKDAKHLNYYLFTNDHCLPSGLYYIAPKTISDETKIELDQIPDLLREVEVIGRLVWYEAENLIWVKNFIYRNKKSDTWLKSVAKSLKTIGNTDAVQRLLDYYLHQFPDIGRKLLAFFEEERPEGSQPYQPPGKAAKPMLPKVKVSDFNPDLKAEKIWSEVLEELKAEVTPSYYRTWLKGVKAISYKGGVFTLGAPRDDVAKYLNQNQRSLIEKTFIPHTRPEVEIVFGVLENE